MFGLPSDEYISHLDLIDDNKNPFFELMLDEMELSNDFRFDELGVTFTKRIYVPTDMVMC